MAAHRKPGPQLLLSVCRTNRYDYDFTRFAAFLDAQRFFQRNLIERVDAHLDAIGVHTAAVALDPNADVVVHNPFQADQNLFHFVAPKWHTQNTAR